MADQVRIFYALQQLSFRPDGVPTVLAEHTGKGVQSAGLNVRLNSENIQQFGQSEIYQSLPGIPEVELSTEKVLDGHCPLYLLATRGSTSPTLLGRAKAKTICAYSIFSDDGDNSSGVALRDMEVSGLQVNSVSYNFPVTGPFTESVSFVGQNKVIKAGSTGFFDGVGDESAPLAPEGVNFRPNFVFGLPSGSGVRAKPSRLPFNDNTKPGSDGVEGIGFSGYNIPRTPGGQDYRSVVQSVRVNANLGREAINQLGRLVPYARLINPNVEVTCDIEVLSTSGDLFQVTETGTAGYGKNVQRQPIRIQLDEGLRINLGDKCELQSSEYGNANAGGGNATIRYQYRTYNKFTVTHPDDPSGLVDPDPNG